MFTIQVAITYRLTYEVKLFIMSNLKFKRVIVIPIFIIYCRILRNKSDVYLLVNQGKSKDKLNENLAILPIWTWNWDLLSDKDVQALYKYLQ